MSPFDLLAHAVTLLANANATEADLRRAVSASYYALFNALTASAADAVGRNVPDPMRHQLRRTFGHGEVLKVCSAYINDNAKGGQLPARPVSPELLRVCNGFKELIEARENADYDLSKVVSHANAIAYVDLATDCVFLWDRILGSTEAATFVATLYLMGRRRG